MTTSNTTRQTVRNFADLPGDAFIQKAALCALLAIHTDTVSRKLKAHAVFPRPVIVSSNVHRWRVSDVRRYLADPAGYTH